MENWKPIPFAPGYEVSDHGRVRSWRSGGQQPPRQQPRLLKPCKAGPGYLTFVTWVQGKGRTVPVHRVVALLFIGDPPPGKPMVLHNDGNKLNNVVSNLRWGDKRDNYLDSLIHAKARKVSAEVHEQLIGGEG